MGQEVVHVPAPEAGEVPRTHLGSGERPEHGPEPEIEHLEDHRLLAVRPPGDHDPPRVRIFGERGDEGREVLRPVLAVAVHRHHHVVIAEARTGHA